MIVAPDLLILVQGFGGSCRRSDTLLLELRTGQGTEEETEMTFFWEEAPDPQNEMKEDYLKGYKGD